MIINVHTSGTKGWGYGAAAVPDLQAQDLNIYYHEAIPSHRERYNKSAILIKRTGEGNSFNIGKFEISKFRLLNCSAYKAVYCIMLKEVKDLLRRSTTRWNLPQYKILNLSL